MRKLVLLLLLPAAAAFSCVGWSSNLVVNRLSYLQSCPILSYLQSCPIPAAERRGLCGLTMMGKGKGVPMNMRGEYQKRSQLEQVQKQMMGDDKDGMPIFTIYTRSKVAKIWYPCGSLKGDGRSKSLVEAWRDNALFLKDQYKVALSLA